MALKIFKRGGFVVLQNGTDAEINIPSGSFDYSPIAGGFQFRDTVEGQGVSSLLGDIQDEGGTPIGSVSQVNTYVSALTDSASSGGGTSALIEPVYYISYGGGAVPFPDECLVDMSFSVWNSSTGFFDNKTYDPTGEVFADMQALVNRLNSIQSDYEFFVLDKTILTDYATVNDFLGIRAGTYSIRDLMIGSFVLELSDPFNNTPYQKLSIPTDNEGVIAYSAALELYQDMSTVTGGYEEYIYYTGVAAGNPSGNVNNVQTRFAALHGILLSTTMYTYDINDNILTIKTT